MFLFLILNLYFLNFKLDLQNYYKNIVNIWKAFYLILIPNIKLLDSK